MGIVFFNGIPLGEASNLEEMRQEIIEKRRKGKFPKTMSVYYIPDRDELHIVLDNGRILRPLIVVKDGKPLLTEEHKKKLLNGEITWQQLVDEGIIEYLDADEEDNAYIALSEEEVTKEHTHLELDPAMILGVEASLLPFPEMNRGDRLNYGSRMVVQASGIYLKNYLIRDDTAAQLLVYPELPMVYTQTEEFVGLNKHPNGQNLVIALLSYEGYNIEDALIVNKASIDRGLGRSYFLRTYIAEARRYWGGQEDIIGFPDSDVFGKKLEESYAKLSEEGIINVETFADSDDVLVSRISPIRFIGMQEEIRMGIKNKKDNSVMVRKGEEGIVEKVVLTQNENGEKIIKVTIREPKIPEIGDKFATRHGQKGVIGLIVPEEDMPFTESGITPDIILNPHAIPSRMTVGQLMEILAGKLGALLGERIDGTAFKGDEEEIKNLLLKLGFKEGPREVMYDGRTGRKYKVRIFIGVGYYFRLYHLVSHKLHARARGKVTLLTKQPTEGRSREGGLRFGEMEKDCLIAHGASLTLKERFSSDRYEFYVCNECGLIAYENRRKGKIECPLCKGSDVTRVEMSYAFKLLLDELMSMMIYPKIKVKKKVEI